MKHILSCILLLLFLCHNLVMSQEKYLGPDEFRKIENFTLRPFFNALKIGNVEAIKHCFTEKNSQTTGLLDLQGEELQRYSNKLIRKYADAVFSVERGVSSGDQIIVDVKLEFPGGGWGVKQYYLEKQSVNMDSVSGIPQWRITDERMKQ